MTGPTPADRRRALRRGARREREAAQVLGTKRIQRGRSSAPDVRPVVLPDGRALAVEVKTRKNLPASVLAALKQARKYVRGQSIAVGVISATGDAALAVLDLRDFASLVGVEVPLVVRRPERRRRGPREQLDLFGGAPPTLPQDASDDAGTTPSTSEGTIAPPEPTSTGDEP